jgi:RHS repeat-associated protein
MSAASPSATVFSLTYDFHSGNGNNGNVWAFTNNTDNPRSQSFNYDPLNRLISAQTTGTDCRQTTLNPKQTRYRGYSYGYDPWGNLLSKTLTKCSGENLSVTALANNQLAGYGYDAAGNMTSDLTDGVSAVYDPDNRISTATKNGVTTSYTYDADGNRVAKSAGTTGTLYWYMTPGIVAESDLSGNLQSEYVFFDGERVARKDFPSLAVSYYFSDHLKTTNIVTDAQGNVKNDSDFGPWGAELQFIAKDSNDYKFTGKLRDAETGLDYFGARYYSNGLGRFITPDWAAKAAAVPYAEFADPQSLNLYTYVRDIPTTRLDLDGHDGGTGTLIDTISEEFNAVANEVARGMAGGGAVGVRTVFGAVGLVLFSSTTLGIDQKEREHAYRMEHPQKPQIGHARGAGEHKSQSDDAKDRARTNGALVKPPRGKGSVPKNQRDPKRTATDKEKAKMREEQKGNCAHCLQPLGDEKGEAHHDPVRHADGGSEMKLVHEKCHADLHSCN